MIDNLRPADVHELIDELVRVADRIDHEYSFACLDTGNTNEGPATDAQRLVRLLHRTALELNGSGLGDRDVTEVRYLGYDA